MRILYVEDNPANLFLVQRIARMDNHEVINYTNGEAAIDNFKQDKPDLVLMDLQLEGKLTGLDVVKTLRAAGHQVPIIAVTAYAMIGDKERCLEAGCTAYIAKPIPVGDLVELIKRYGAKTATSTGTNEIVPVAAPGKAAPAPAEATPVAAKPEPAPEAPKSADPAPAASQPAPAALTEKNPPPASAEAISAAAPSPDTTPPPAADAAPPAASEAKPESTPQTEAPAAAPVMPAAASQEAPAEDTKPEKQEAAKDEDATLPSRGGFMVMAEASKEDTTQKASQ
jgi:two-component system cell cycle response regulator DivK